ncbi:sensor histidine kinase [Desulforamulus putei]|uniref:histidine kinase n=1 Tax=Desulforamulus putei DSM 12395 TaxID=1121429 RepID=A0A1M4VCN1_9FIRM|nr:HAMP domain-containing sensor histidine kinase [Desulforamulus putei]SHE66706.1 His Kinase A (phospho-acceptor) domain-containing protein [Desulforamulus putei DSM 12395]
MSENQGDVYSYLLVKEDSAGYKGFANNIHRVVKIKLAGEMAAGIAHEIRNPMTTVRGLLQMLANEKACPGFEERLQVMLEELDRANSIISEVLLLAPTKVSNLKRIILNNILEGLLPTISSEADRTGKKVLFEPGMIPYLWLNEQEIAKLVLNLARNGLEAMSDGGTLRIKTFVDGPEIVLSIQDQGKGIKVGILDMLGTPFFTTKEQGTGLGLAVCYSIAARHNATIKVETGAKGSTFFVRFQHQP